MKNREDRTLKATPETNSRYESTESHLFGTDATEEKALCGADTSADYRRGLRRLPGEPVAWTLWVGTLCEGCKAQAVPFAANLTRDLESEGLLDEAEEHRQLADTLLRETGLGRFSG